MDPRMLLVRRLLLLNVFEAWLPTATEVEIGAGNPFDEQLLAMEDMLRRLFLSKKSS